MEQSQEKLKVLWWANADWCPCFDVETEVLTIAGWKYFKNLSYGDEIATLNPVTEFIEYHKPDAIINEPYSGLMYRHESKHLSIMCTPNHKLYVKLRSKKGFSLIEAADIYGKWDVEHYCGGADWSGVNQETYLIPPAEDYKNSVKHIGEVDLSDFVSWLGWYIAEGSYTIGSKREFIVSLALNNKEADEVYDLCKQTFPMLSWFKTKEKSKTNVRTYSKELYKYVKPLGRSHEKHVPTDIKNLSSKYLEKLLSSLIRGDGTMQKTLMLFTTSSTRLRDDIMELALKLGHATKYIKHGDKNTEKWFASENRMIIQRHDSWRVSINPKHKTPAPVQRKFIEKWEPSPDGRIYCAVVPNHIMVVRRNGKAYFSGNTGYGVGTKGVVPRIKHRYDTRILCFWGLEGRALFLDDILHYPKLFSPLGDDAADLICNNWKPDFMVTFFDIWIAEMEERTGRPFFTGIHDRWIPWAPVDHDPSPVGITNQARKAYHCVTMSKFGQDALAKEGVETTLIPLGADTSVYKPTEDKQADVDFSILHSLPMTADNYVDWSNEDFIIGVNAAPKDPVRKNFDGTFDAFKIFLEQNPDARKDARMYLQTWKQFPSGWPLPFLAKEKGIDKYLRVTHPYNMYCAFNEQSLAKLTRSWDVLSNCSTREGYGIPIIEACASGVPPVCTNYTCHSEDTKLLTEYGLKTHKEIKKGEKVWTLNNGNLELNEVEAIHVYSYDGELVSFKNKAVDLLVTPNHRMLYKKPHRKREKNYEIKEAKDFLKHGDESITYLPTVGVWVGKETPCLNTSIYNNDLNTTSKPLPTETSTNLLMRIAGWYVSEGWLGQDKTKEKNLIRISNTKYQDEIFRLFKELGLNPSIINGTFTGVQAYSIALARFLKQFGLGAQNKKIPRWVLALSRTHLQCLFETLMKGDGSKCGSDKYMVYITSSKQLKDDVAELFLKLGFSPKTSLRKNYVGMIQGRQIKTKLPNYAINIRRQSKGSIRGKHITKEPYNGLVWCVTTKNGNFFVERNGLITCSGNSMIELTEGHGWLIDGYVGPATKTNLLSYGMDPDTFEMAEAYGEAYNSPDKTRKLGEKAREFSLDYDWEIISRLWMHLLDKLGEDIRWKPLSERRVE